MTDVYDQESDRPAPARPAELKRPLESRQTVFLAVDAIAVLLAGIAIGRVTASSSSAPSWPSSACDGPNAAVSQFMTAATNSPNGSSEAQRNGRLFAQVVVQNPNCFTADLRAQAQELLNTLHG
ncbi:hypothetical protein [Kitasatospora sp. NPDC056731]|uniref:hypothetical protein n=1 Tax=Kitasatospora sp. NPDC056731 TaxID=3155422 RepID=UPI0034425C3B